MLRLLSNKHMTNGNILIMGTGSYGDLVPMVNFAKDCMTLGYKTTIFTNFDFKDSVLKEGIRFIPMPLNNNLAI